MTCFGYLNPKLLNPLVAKLLILGLTLCLLPGTAMGKPATWIKTDSGAKALLYLPDNYTEYSTYPTIVALHGMKETPWKALEHWKPVAEKLSYILVCPKGSNFNEGYIRRPQDDRKKIVDIWRYMIRNYPVDKTESLIAGFSRGGNFAIETGLLYPKDFPHVLCIFGYFNKGMDKVVAKYSRSRRYRHSSFYFITGKGDYSEQSLTWGRNVLNAHKVRVNLKVYPDLYHQYPPHLDKVVQNIQRWMLNQP